MDVSDDVSPPSDQLSGLASKDATTVSRAKDSETLSTKELVSLALQFLSTCSNEMLLFVVAGLMGATYIFLGRLGLILIGITLGIALHASWDGSNSHLLEPQTLSRKQLSLRVSHRLLDWQNNERVVYDSSSDKNEEPPPDATSDLGFDPSFYGPATASALQSLVDAAIKDYVNYWYEPILPSELTFPKSCRRTMTVFINSLSNHLWRKRTADTFLEFLTNSSSMVIVFLNELSTAFEAADPSATAKDAILRYLESNPDSSLASLLERQQQQRKLKMISDDICSLFLEHSAYKCTPLRTFFREILAGVALESTILRMSQPEFINGWITYLYSEGESEIMSAIDAGVEGARTHGITGAKSVTSVPVKDDPPIPVSNKSAQATEEAILEAKRLSALIATQASRETRSVQNQAREKDNLAEERLSESGASLESRATGGAEQPQKVEPNLGSVDAPVFTLHNASVTMDDSMDSGEKTTFRFKPSSSYLIQIETRSGRSTGWMVFRRYADFESVHETLGTISRLNQLRFEDSHPFVPPWKGQTRQALARDLERYLRDALQLEPLAESVTMRRFLDKDGGLVAEPANVSAKPGFVFPGQNAFETVGKGVLGGGKAVFEGVSGGGKAVLEGVTGVFGGASKKVHNDDKRASPPLSGPKIGENLRFSSESTDEQALSFSIPGSPPLSEAATQSSDTPVRTPESEGDAANESNGRSSSDSVSMVRNPSTFAEKGGNKQAIGLGSRISADKSGERKTQSSPITIDETRMAVELIFAVINEMYSLSSAWNIRRTLLNAAKSYILRPGNPSLETIRHLLQESMIDSHTSDDAIAGYLTKVRENALPTTEELSAWPPPVSEYEQERQRQAARRILVQKGLPQAITSVMGAVASREALGKIFDSLQIEVVARGFVFSIFLQALRAVAL
ncbi:PXA domain-containing protein [Aspergillus heterothallicus]